MPLTGPRPPPAPTVEDCWEDDTQSPFADNRAPANVAVKRSKSTEFDSKSVADKKSHDGSDSGYSSKAGTSENISAPAIKKGGDLKIDTTPIERQRQPYVFAPNRPEGSRSPTKAKAVKGEEDMPKQPQRFRHLYGVCWVCDQYGHHFDIDKEISRPATAAPMQKVTKSPAPKMRAKEEGDERPAPSRRSSSTSKRESRSRPGSMYVPGGVYGFPPPPVDYSHPMLVAHGWQTPPHHIPQQIPQYPSQYQYQYHAPPTPMSATYAQQPNFFDSHPVQYSHTPEPFYRDPAMNGYDESLGYYKASSHEGEVSKKSSREGRARSGTQKTKKSPEPDRSHTTKMAADKISMPPPPRPEPVRPIIRKSSTDYPNMSRRQPVFEDDDNDPRETQNIIARERRTSHSRPPSSYKPVPNAEILHRPRARKSSSYSTSSGTIQVASTQREKYRSRPDSLEQKVADVENYVGKSRSKEPESEKFVSKARSPTLSDSEEYMSKVDKEIVNALLTTEALRKHEQKGSSAQSDAGSGLSKQSSSRDSATFRTRASTTTTNNQMSITMENGICLTIPANYGDIPIDIVLGNLRLSSTNQTPREEEPRIRELKRIEQRAMSEVSHTSRRSMTNSSAVSANRSKDEPQAVTRTKQNGGSSKRPSRAQSTTRADQDIRSIDYSLLDESYYLDYGA